MGWKGLISYQLLKGQLRYAQAFEFKPSQIVSPVLTTISYENTIGSMLTSTKCLRVKFCLVDA